jgi:hypothetical protein
MLEGQVELIAHGTAARSQVLPRHYVHGCQSRPASRATSATATASAPSSSMSVPSLSRLWRGERSLRQARESLGQGKAIAWATHAVDAGYADQSHLVRDCKEISGRTPTQIAAQARQDEADWIHRL